MGKLSGRNNRKVNISTVPAGVNYSVLFVIQVGVKKQVNSVAGTRARYINVYE